MTERSMNENISSDTYRNTLVGTRISFRFCGRVVWRTVRDVMRKNHKCNALVRINGYDFWVKERSILATQNRDRIKP